MGLSMITLLDETCPSPYENLALDEVLFEECERSGTTAYLRFWKADTTFVVLGYANRVSPEVNIDRCRADGIPILRRISGGGAVVQSNGCLSYTLVLPMSKEQELHSLSGANRFIMERIRRAVAGLLSGASVCVEGDTDLVVNGFKVAGNAQRRGIRAVLFHGVFLVNTDLRLIEQFLPMPSRVPEYRFRRSHADFVRNLGLPFCALQDAIAHEWQAAPGDFALPIDRIRTLVQTRYSLHSWNMRI